jgi:cell division protein FtsI/penicillin-binding protein 2
MLVAALAFGVGVVVGAGGESATRTTAQAFADAWAGSDYAAMHALLTPQARQRTPLKRFAAAYRDAAATATATGIVAGRAGEPAEDGRVSVPMQVRTRLFGTLASPLVLPTAPVEGGKVGIDWRPELVHPGLRAGEELTRKTRMPPRADLLARDGTPLAEGQLRTTAVPGASDIVGTVGEAPPERAAELDARGVPDGTPVGLSGLERAFDEELAGRPGGELRAGPRLLATVKPLAGRPVRTSIDPEVQEAAVTALAGRYGGIAAIRPRTGEVLGLAGIAYSAPQPPGSVFKIITLAAALEAGVAKPSDSFPVQQAAILEGTELENANGEYCGGTLRLSFAHSCNSVFAPMGAELGAKRLVAAAERFGFNEQPPIAAARPSTIPEAGEIGDDLAVGSTAIGQGKVLATPLLFADVAATIAEHGMRPEPTLRKGETKEQQRAIPAEVARKVGAYMRAVVTEGTGTAAAIPGVKVAGKTGTAELRDTTKEPDPQTGEPAAPDGTDTNAWFAAFAPYAKPRVAVAVMLIGQGAGGATAAPAARLVLEAGLRR